MATEKADWKKRGVTYVGGALDGEVHTVFPARPSISLASDKAGPNIVESYVRTERAIDGNTVYEWQKQWEEDSDD